MKRFLIIVLIIVVILVAAVFIFGGRIKSYIASQIESIAGDILNPQLVIGDLSYRFPYTVKVSDLSLEQDGVKIVEVPQCTITLASIPYTQGQVRFEGFELESPVLRIVIDEKGDMVGWGDLLKPSEDGASSSESTSRTSDSFEVRKISISNATIEFSDSSSGADKMTLDQINLAIDARPNSSSASKSASAKTSGKNPIPKGAPEIPAGQGWYHITTALDRSPLININIDGGLDIDSGNVLLRSLVVTATLDPKNVSVLPPQVQSFVRNHDLRGDLKLTSWGSILADNPSEGPLDVEIALNEASIGSDQAMLEIESLLTKINLKSDILFMESMTAKLLGGTLEADAELVLSEEPPQAAHRPETDSDEAIVSDSTIPGRAAFSLAAGLQLNDIDLQKLTSKRPANDQILGLLNVDLEMVGVATELPKTLDGGGRVQVSKGRLASIPIISALGRAMRAVLLQTTHDDRADVDLTLREDGVVLDNLSIITGLMAARGTGIIRFDDTLDLVVNGGPMERVQASLGRLGSALGSLTDRIVRYQITGSLDSPDVRVRPLGISVSDPTAPPKKADEPEGAPEEK